MSYHKRIILDFDDTLAFHKNRDFDNSKPNKPLINKTNRLYDTGWQIDIFTARGNLSCATRAEAREKYLPGMEAWLDKHGVKYHSISFEKPLAAYYIDDKGMTPEDFIEIEINQLEGGLSGSDIYTDGKMVHKKDPRAHEVRDWFEKAKDVNTPYIDRIVGDTITMEYIDHDKDFFENKIYIALGLIQESLEKICKIEINDTVEFSTYLDRIKSHCDLAGIDTFYSVHNQLKLIELRNTFSHGDFGITNMLFKDFSLYLIDPIPEVFGCLELDVAKLIASLYINRYSEKCITLAYNAMSSYNNIDHEVLNILIASEMIRVYKYHPNKDFIIECVNNVYKQS